MNINKTDHKKRAKRRTRRAAIAIEFIILFIFWVVLSGRFDLKNLIIGVCASALVTFLTHAFIYGKRSTEEETSVGNLLKCALRLIRYLPWLILAIVKANIQVAAILIKPRMPIDPVLLQFETKMHKGIS